ncbi:hypothetical protein [Nitrosospira briensis]|nr:hypothetical protein [Nitrosospira briensis]
MDELEADEFELGEEYESESYETELESPFDEIEEMELAAELLSVQSEEELDQFFGKIFSRLKGRLKKVGKAFRPLKGMFKGLVKKALPVVGGALGSFIPIPGVGTAVGSALGSAVGKALETEFEGMDPEDQEFEVAKRIVRVTGAAAKQATAAGPDVDPQAAAKAALVAAARQHVPNLGSVTRNRAGGKSAAGAGSGRSGRWYRRGRKIVLLGV